ncbi:MAG: Inositol 2-dehydrogenase/D-chiro-inositol 3-dehydrogenase [Prosthecobacter sp.]|nr:Inositol 2-dehydrogenase/D-chiro-inositol 3-dehydrogenase [Prosthecobacter sp.]
MTTRRQFFASAAALAALPLQAEAAARLRIGQIGTAHAHAGGKMTSLRGLADLWDVAGLVEPDASRRQQAAQTAIYQGLPRLSESELLGDSTVRAVAVETTIEDSCSTALRCLQAGKHIHLDKPGALDHGEFKAMRLEAEKRGLTVQMGYMLRYNPAFELLFKAVREGWLGEITEIDAAMGKLADPGTRAKLAPLPGGGFFELACHVTDAIVTLLGKPRSVQAYSTPSGTDGVQDNQMAVLAYDKATAVIRCNHADPFGGPRRRFNVTGTQGTFEIVPLESGRVSLSLTSAQGGYKKGTQALSLDVPKDRYIGEFIDLAKIIRGEKKLAWDAAHDIAVHETVLRGAGVWKDV